MSHLQRLPRLSIERTQIIGKVFVDEHPTLPDLGPENQASLDAAAQFLGVQAQEKGGLL